MAGPLLVCAATSKELDAAIPAGAGVLAAVTGVGIPLTLLSLEPLLREHRPSLILNVGIAGAYPGSGLSIGEAVAGESDVFGDLGLETPGPERFLPLATQAWADSAYKEPLALTLEPWAALPALRRGRGCTVNACTGTAATGALRRRLFGADFESMEGAAVALLGRRAGIPVAELRTISNIASDRDMRPENIETALRALGAALRPLLGGAA